MDTTAVTRRFDLTDAAWARQPPMLPSAKKSGRPSKWSKRRLIDGIRWRVRVGACDRPTQQRRLALAACATTLAGKPAAGSTQRRKTSVFYNALELGRLGSNPVDRIQWTAPAVAASVDRRVVVSPVLVGLLRAHIKRFGTTLDGRIFQTARGGILQDSGYNEVWDQARQEALTSAQYRSPLGRRPYDLRHAAVSLWLNSGVPATEVVRRARHGVAVLLNIYAHCIDGQATAANQRIADALGIQDAEEGLGDEGDGDTNQAS